MEIKKNEFKNINLLNINGEEDGNIINNKSNQNKKEKSIDKNKNYNSNINKNNNDSRDSSYQKHYEKKLKIIDKYLNNKEMNSLNKLQIFVNNKYNNFPSIFTIENNNENIPILNIDLLSKEFIDYKNSFNMNNNEKNKLKILEEENTFLRKELEFVKQK